MMIMSPESFRRAAVNLVKARVQPSVCWHITRPMLAGLSEGL